MAGRVAIVGGRSVSPAGADQVTQVATSLVAHGHSLVTGCATGADGAAVTAALTGRVPLSSLHVLAAMGGAHVVCRQCLQCRRLQHKAAPCPGGRGAAHICHCVRG